MKRTLPTPWKPTKAQILATRNKLVPDLVAKTLIVLFAGINRGLYTAAIGRHFGRPGNASGPPSTAAASPHAFSITTERTCRSRHGLSVGLAAWAGIVSASTVIGPPPAALTPWPSPRPPSAAR
jgi:hypothetical protein